MAFCKTERQRLQSRDRGRRTDRADGSTPFCLAGIDFVVLERRPTIVEDQGASLVVYPTTFRVMEQFRILKPKPTAGSELVHHLSLTADGCVFKEGTRYTRLRENHGYGATATHRADLVGTFLQGPPGGGGRKGLDQQEARQHWTVGAGVEVTCTDGIVYQGSIVIGADDVHSTTRHLMREAALKNDPSRDLDAEDPFPAAYQLLFGAFPSLSAAGRGYDIHAKDMSIMVIEEYEARRKSAANSLVANAAHSGKETRMHAWANTTFYLISRWLIIPKFVEDLVIRFMISPELAGFLDFLAIDRRL
ncbi:hypothetical protein N0V88_004504 [Collariella sp. IMI 366227]|nr:hypothetical protein N0V88_004504 [Collariella sp. IMI 366227]